MGKLLRLSLHVPHVAPIFPALSEAGTADLRRGAWRPTAEGKSGREGATCRSSLRH